jgi:hypothetical protein
VKGLATAQVRATSAREPPIPAAVDHRHAPLVVADGTLEALKWAAALLMVLDHANKFLYGEALPVIFQVGRIVMPIFGFVLAYNLTRPGAYVRGVYSRMMYRLAFWGLAATPMYIILNGTLVKANAWWPFNILFMLLLVVALVRLIEQGGAKRIAAAVALFLVAGAFVEFLWFGVACGLGAWAYCHKPSWSRLALWILATLSLSIVNGNAWALASMPLLLCVTKLNVRVPRWRWAFYVLYPAHLLAILIVKLQWY